MSATQKFHRVANDALVTISEHSPAGSKLALVIYTPGEPEQDIILRDEGLDDNEVISALRRRGFSIDGDNAYKRDLCDSITGALMLGAHNKNPPPAGQWQQPLSSPRPWGCFSAGEDGHRGRLVFPTSVGVFLHIHFTKEAVR